MPDFEACFNSKICSEKVLTVEYVRGKIPPLAVKKQVKLVRHPETERTDRLLRNDDSYVIESTMKMVELINRYQTKAEAWFFFL